MIGDGSILRSAIGGAISGIAGRFGIQTSAIAPMTNAIATQMAKDPQVVNQLNAEHPVQSRVVLGSVLAMLGGLFTAAADLKMMFEGGAFDIDRAAMDIAVIGGAGFALYGRLKTGLVPLFTRRK